MEKSKPPTVWRLNLVTSSDDDRNPRKFCLERGILGIGWRLEDTPPPDLDYKAYRRWAKDHFPHDNWGSYKSAFRALAKRMEVGDLCWARDTDGIYYLAEVTGDWEYHDDKDHRAVDIHHFRPCTWYKVGTADQVPASLIEAFRGRALERFAVNSPAARWLTRSIHARRADRPQPPMPDDPSVWGLLSADDMEDVVAAYLQREGYVVIPSTAKRSTPGYEYSLVSPSGDIAIVQVKRGSLDPTDFQDYEEQVILFARSGYRAAGSGGVRCLKKEEIEAFMQKHPERLPPRVQHCLEVLERS